MTAAQEFLNQQMALLRSMQNDIEFFKSRQAEEQSAIDEAKRLAAKKLATKRKLATKQTEAGLPPADIRKQAKAILKARKEKAISDRMNDEKPVLPLRPGGPDLQGKVKVRLDVRTEVYANPDYDIEELRQKYLRKHNDIEPIGDNSATKAYRKVKEILPGEIYELVKMGER